MSHMQCTQYITIIILLSLQDHFLLLLQQVNSSFPIFYIIIVYRFMVYVSSCIALVGHVITYVCAQGHCNHCVTNMSFSVIIIDGHADMLHACRVFLGEVNWPVHL